MNWIKEKISALSSDEPFDEGRRQFLKYLVVLSALGLSSCLPKGRDNGRHTNEEKDEPIQLESHETERHVFSEAELDFLIATIGLTPEIADKLKIHGFTSDRAVRVLIDGASEEFKLVKRPTSFFQTSISYKPGVGSEPGVWVKTLHTQQPIQTELFRKSFEAMRASVEISGFPDDAVKFTKVMVGADQNAKDAIVMREMGVSLRSALKNGLITSEQAVIAFQKAFTQAVQLASRGFWFADANPGNVLVKVENGQVTRVTLIDFTNKKIGADPIRNPYIIDSLKRAFKNQIRHLGQAAHLFSFEKAIAQVPEEVMQKLRVGYANHISDLRVTQETRNGSKVISEIKAVPKASTKLAGASARIISNPEGAVVIEMNPFPKFDSFLRATKKFANNALNFLILVALVDMAGGRKWGQINKAEFRFNDAQSKILLDPNNIWDLVDKHIAEHRVWQLVGFDEHAEEFTEQLRELSGLVGNPLSGIDMMDIVEKRLAGFKDSHLKPIELFGSGPQHIDQSRSTGLFFSRLLTPDGVKALVIWQKPAENSTTPFSELIKMILVKDPDDGKWKMFELNDVNLTLPGTMASTPQLRGTINLNEDSEYLEIHFLDLGSNQSGLPIPITIIESLIS